MSEIDEPDSPKPARSPVKPLPRLWKAESDEPEDESPGQPADGHSANNSTNGLDGASGQTSSKTGASGGKKKKKKATEPAAIGDKSDSNKVLKEETPSLDTYESRRRARLIMGGLTATCVILVLWIGYRTFLYDPSSVDMPFDDPSAAYQGGPEPKPSKDGEARFMLNRAEELYKNKRSDQAIAMLNKIVTAYKGTATADEARAALDRSEKDLPLFASGPIVLAVPEKKAPAPTPSAPPPEAVVEAKPIDGQAAKGAEPRSCCRPTRPRWSWFHRRCGIEPSPPGLPSLPGQSPRGFSPIFRPVSTSRAGQW